MLQIRIRKNSSKNYKKAIEIALSLGGVYTEGDMMVTIPEHDLPNAYNILRSLIEIIQRWKGTSATFRGRKVNLYRFVFVQYHQVAECGSKKIRSCDPDYCGVWNGFPTWGCRMIQKIFLNTVGSGNYKSSTKYWYNFGRFDSRGVWVIDRGKVMSRIMFEIEESGLDVCPFFNIDEVRKRVYQDLPGYIVPDNYNYRLHYVKVFEGGRDILKAVNIRHIGDLRDAPGLINRRLMYRIHSAMDYFRAQPPEISEPIRVKLMESVTELREARVAPIDKAFDKDGLGKN